MSQSFYLSRQVTPSASASYAVDSPVTDAELWHEVAYLRPVLESVDDREYLRFAETSVAVGDSTVLPTRLDLDLVNGPPMVHRPMSVAARHPALPGSVSEVVRRGAEEQVCRIDAWAIVAAMQNIQTVRDRPVGIFPSQTVRVIHPAVPPTLSIMPTANGTGPLDTIGPPSSYCHTEKG